MSGHQPHRYRTRAKTSQETCKDEKQQSRYPKRRAKEDQLRPGMNKIENIRRVALQSQKKFRKAHARHMSEDSSEPPRDISTQGMYALPVSTDPTMSDDPYNRIIPIPDRFKFWKNTAEKDDHPGYVPKNSDPKPVSHFDEDKDIQIGEEQVRVWPRGKYARDAAHYELLELLSDKYRNRKDAIENIAEELDVPEDIVRARIRNLKLHAYPKWSEEEDGIIVEHARITRGNYDKPELEKVRSQMAMYEAISSRMLRRTTHQMVARTSFINMLLDRIRDIYDVNVSDDSGPEDDTSKFENGSTIADFNKAIELVRFYGHNEQELEERMEEVFPKPVVEALKKQLEACYTSSSFAWSLKEDRILLRSYNQAEDKDDWEAISQNLTMRIPETCRERYEEINRLYNITGWLVLTGKV